MAKSHRTTHDSPWLSVSPYDLIKGRFPATPSLPRANDGVGARVIPLLTFGACCSYHLSSSTTTGCELCVCLHLRLSRHRRSRKASTLTFSRHLRFANDHLPCLPNTLLSISEIGLVVVTMYTLRTIPTIYTPCCKLFNAMLVPNPHIHN